MDEYTLTDAIPKARESAKARNFKQTFDLAIALKNLDLKNPAHKIKEEVLLPHGRGKPVKIAAIADGETAENAKKAGITIIISKDDLVKLSKDKKQAKKLISSVDFLVSQPDLMVEVGKTLGPILGPRGKMPKPVPPKADLTPILARFNKLVNVQIKNQPIIHCLVGTEEMTDKQILENTEVVLEAVKRKLPQGVQNIRSVHVKLTMGASVRLEALK